MPLKSVDKPRPSPFEGLDAAAASQPREIVDFSPGQGDKTSRAAQFLVTGKQQTPIRSPSSVFESLIGDLDRRKQILETDETPWKMICALDIAGKNGAQMVGTGWFAGPRTVITAGHCVFDPIELGGWATEIRVMPGRSGDTMLGNVRATKFSTTDRWLQAQERDYDYGVIHLDTDLGAASGSFGLGVLPDAELTTLRVNVAGYPVTPGNGERQYFHANRIKAVTARRIFYDVDTTPGESGAPVWAYPDGDKTKPIVVGIHAYGIQGAPAELAVTSNSGPRILPEVLGVIKDWMKKGTPT
jgi:V8-like Glu-specific endopeptidase